MNGVRYCLHRLTMSVVKRLFRMYINFIPSVVFFSLCALLTDTSDE